MVLLTRTTTNITQIYNGSGSDGLVNFLTTFGGVLVAAVLALLAALWLEGHKRTRDTAEECAQLLDVIDNNASELQWRILFFLQDAGELTFLMDEHLAKYGT